MKNITKSALVFLALGILGYLGKGLLPKAVANNKTSPKEVNKPKPLPIILDTDIAPDFDDAGAMAVLHALADKGEAKILATISCNRYAGCAPLLEVINNYYNKPNIPIGAVKNEGADFGDKNKWNEVVVANFPHQLKTTDDAPDAVEVYRSILAKQPNKSAIIVTVGFLTNLKNLLQSGPDKYSKLDGAALVAKKVKKLVVMGGAFPQGKEFNIHIDAPSSKYTFAHWPTPVLFSGVEIGNKILTGNRLVQLGAANNPVRQSYDYCLKTYQGQTHPNGRMSWDQTAVLAAVRGPEPYWDVVTGQIKINEDGTNEWIDGGNKQHSYLVPKMLPEEVAVVIEDLMLHEPK
ncbi:nucleoside hydrolase [Adhaeribacter rhizoryzae]|uniref:Nucleoside hydrolase n=1 Tax=Adhaeribacter rhizoryzae TaxID=2607907 RepID=A0A5M6DJ37_9BACT|nr:nucleoside hydrolase [Adhaeribacter rhizoryzae]KAA5547568.1 nucleoside hydrolase [Adhaeribacter rhizoryzae]